MKRLYLISKPKYVSKLNKVARLFEGTNIVICSRWINVLEPPKTTSGWKDLWNNVVEDMRVADMAIILPDRKSEFRGGLVEIGMALSKGIPIYQLGTCRSFQNDSVSDSSFTLHGNYFQFNELSFDMDTATPDQICIMIDNVCRFEFGSQEKNWP